MSQWRPSFPLIAHQERIYLDNAATTQKPLSVIESVIQVYTADNAPVHRGLYEAAEVMTGRYEQVRELIAQWIGAFSDEIVFTNGATDGINMVAAAWAAHMLQPGDEIVITALEHHSNSLPWVVLAQRHGFVLKIIPVRGEDRALLALEDIQALITTRTKLVAVTLYSNVRGPLSDEELEAIVTRAREVGAAVVLDAAQVPAHAQITIGRWNPDFLVFSGHKCFAPSGIGILYCNRAQHPFLRPYRLGGGMVYNAHMKSLAWNPMPYLLEAGTPPLEGVIGLGAAVTYLKNISYADIRSHERQLTSLWLDALATISGVRIIGDTVSLKQHSSLVSCTIAGIHAHDLAAYLSLKGVAMRAGHHCCQQLHEDVGMSSTLRMSCALYTTQEEVLKAAEVLCEAVSTLRR